jgi:hypothetical protein
MRYRLLIFVLIVSGFKLTGQTAMETNRGKVSYKTTQNIYVKFESTEGISKDDTLFIKQDEKLVPALIVREISSISCVCIPFPDLQLSVGDEILSRNKMIRQKKSGTLPADTSVKQTTEERDTIQNPKTQPKTNIQLISGRFSISSYTNFSSETATSQRMRYSLLLNARNIGNTRLSGEAYIDFNHKFNDWSEIQSDIFNGLKIYSLALNYEFNRNNKLWLGRKINPRISNMGAIDGLQYELKLKSFTVGVVGGFRPDYLNYSFNPHLLQYGAYLGHDYSNKKGNMQTTLAFIEQMNNGVTDRRFAYLQHSNSLLSNLYFFGSVEVGLYKKVMNPVDSTEKDTTYRKDNSPTLSNLYLSLRYRPIRQLSFSISYSALKNIIYYETYPKNILERMIETATVQGFMFQGSYQPVNNLSLGINAGYRDSKNDPKPTKNFYGYLTYSRVPGINISATASATLLETGYISGKIYSLELSRDFMKGKLYIGINYRYVDYQFVNIDSKTVQNMGELNLTWRILKKLSCSLYYEGTFENTVNFNRVYISLTQRF